AQRFMKTGRDFKARAGGSASRAFLGILNRDEARAHRPPTSPASYSCLRGGSADDARATQKIPKRLAGLAAFHIVRQEPIERRENFRLGQILRIELVQTLARQPAAEEQVVAARRLADERDLGDIRPRAAVRVAGDAQQNVLVGEAVLREHGLELLEQDRQIALGL